MITAEKFAARAVNGGYIGIPYDVLDCQGFVERVLYDLGIRKPNGTAYNWKGSNSMWRNYYKWRGTIADCKKAYGIIPQGALVYKMRQDGGEVERGYHDGLGNFYHVGLYIGGYDQMGIHSSTGGVQYAASLKGWTHVGLLSMLDYTGSGAEDPGVTNRLLSIITDIKKLADEAERIINHGSV